MPAIYTSGEASVNSAVQRAVDEVRLTFGDRQVTTASDGSGGAYVVIADLALSERFVQATTWLGFQLSYLYPASDVYPHYVCFDLARKDGSPLGAGCSQTIWGYNGAPAIQISRKSNRWNPKIDTAALKAVKVLAWINSSA